MVDGAKDQTWRGVFAVLTTPFHEDGSIDFESVEAQVAFCIAAGAHGLVANVNASEGWTLSDAERKRVADRVIRTAGGRLPIVVGVTAGSAQSAVEFAHHARECGADAIIAMPPNGNSSHAPATILDYFQRIAAAAALPLFIQNYHTPAASQMHPELVARIVREVEHADFIKEEASRPNEAMTLEIALAGPKLRGVMGGLGGRYMLDEYARGACGTMPACEAVDVHVQVWEALDNGDARGARDLFNRLLPLLNYEALTPGVYKAVLQRRGVIASSFMRTHAGNPLDAADERELSLILEDMHGLFRLEPPGAVPVASDRLAER
jgi:4-hydroxy-tetrahydrodipicolinate synthase